MIFVFGTVFFAVICAYRYLVDIWFNYCNKKGYSYLICTIVALVLPALITSCVCQIINMIYDYS